MKLLLDTRLLLWAASSPEKLSKSARKLTEDPDSEPTFSAASIWEIAIKSGMGRDDFEVDANVLRSGLLGNGYTELPISGAHAAAVATLPPLHRDPFDRMLVAQANVEGITLLTADAKVAAYPGPIRKV